MATDNTKQLDRIGKMMPPHQLGLNEVQWRAFAKVLEGLELNLIPQFDMDHWPCCIRGLCGKHGAKFSEDDDERLFSLFCGHQGHFRYDQAKAAEVLRTFLFTGQVDWGVELD